MSGWDFQINRSGVTNAAGTANWRLRAATTAEAAAAVADGVPATDADVVGGLQQTGTITFASGDVQKTVRADVAPNTTPGQGKRVVVFEVLSVTPGGSVIDTPTAIGIITEDDEASGGNLVQHGTTAKVPVRDVGVQQGQYVAWDLPATGRIGVPQFAYLSAKDANNSPMLGVVLNSGGDRGWVLKRLIDGTVNDFLTGAWPDTTALPNASTYRIEVSRYAGNGWDIKVNGVAVVGGGSNFNDLWSTAIQGNLVGFEGSEATATNVVTGTK